MKIIHVVGARPNFMKIAPIIDAITTYNLTSDRPINQTLVHTGQHYDEKLSNLFFEDLRIPEPDIDLEVGSASHAEQTAEIMKRFEHVLLRGKPDYVLVVGDVNSTIACALVAKKLGIKVIHVEAGLRSFDMTMPEEINRILTDAISDLLFITEKSAEKNLLREGIPREKIHFVGNVMIDTLLQHKEKAQESKILQQLGLSIRNLTTPYALLTLHRPSNVDNKHTLQGILEALNEISKQIPIIFPAHPRTQKKIKEFGFEQCFSELSTLNPQSSTLKNVIYSIDPMGYLDFISLMSNAKLVMTDSGGIQEETTVLGVPCVTLRKNTERPVTVTNGTNVIACTEKDNIIKMAISLLNHHSKPNEHRIPPLWDGKAAERIVDIITSILR